tara:strand:+ start:256 stop:369 length:114 start_codon:yes stop_codon:yes gene_type:complete
MKAVKTYFGALEVNEKILFGSKFFSIYEIYIKNYFFE